MRTQFNSDVSISAYERNKNIDTHPNIDFNQSNDDNMQITWSQKIRNVYVASQKIRNVHVASQSPPPPPPPPPPPRIQGSLINNHCVSKGNLSIMKSVSMSHLTINTRKGVITDRPHEFHALLLSGQIKRIYYTCKIFVFWIGCCLAPYAWV